MSQTSREIATRLERYQRLLDLSAVWPEISERDFHAAHGAIARATAAVLAERPAPAELSPDLPPRALGIAAFASGMGALLGYWIEIGVLAAPAPAAGLLERHLDHGRRRAARLGAQLERVLDAFSDRGVTAVLLKGAETAFAYFPEPGTRPMTDLDLFVGREATEPAEDALRSLGFVRGEGWGERTVWHPEAATAALHSLEINHADNSWSVDLHATLDRGYPGIVIRFGADPNAERGTRNAERAAPASVIHRSLDDRSAVPHSAFPVPTLSHPLKLAYLASHTSQDFTTMQLVRLVELVLVIRRDFTGRPVLWEEFLRFVASRRIERFVYPSLELADRLVPGTLHPEVRRNLLPRVSRRLRRIVERTDVETLIRFRARWISWRLMWSASVRDYLRDLGHALWPRATTGSLGVRRLVTHQGRRVWRTIARVMDL